MPTVNQYTKLRAWYLATLRRKISADIQSGVLTPAGLIQADRKAVEQRILESAAPKAANAYKPLYLPAVFCVLAPLLATVPAFFLLLEKGLVWSIAACLVPGLLGSLAILIFIQKRVLTIADQIASSLDEATERENAIADYALDFVCALDRQGCVAAASPSIERTLGYRLHEFVGKSFSIFVAADDVERVNNAIASIGPGSMRKQKNFEAGMTNRAGKILDIAWQCEWSETESMLFCLGRDISIAKQMERIRKEFVTMVGHDIRAPMSSILLSIEVLQNEAEISENGKRILSNAGQAIRRLLKLVQELLDLERVEAGKLPITKKNEDLKTIIEESIAAMSAMARGKNVTLKPPEKTILAYVDKDRIVQVLINLLANAIRFSPENESISIELDCDEIKKQACVKITDAGPGIATADQELIFERFQQAGAEQKMHGSGLGLAICKTLVVAHGGEIGVISQTGRGSTFWFSLPLQHLSEEQPAE